MSKPIVTKEVEGDHYSYDGQFHEINGCRRLAIQMTLNLLILPNFCDMKALRRHSIFWDVISPQDLNQQNKEVVMRTLQQGLEKLKKDIKEGRVNESTIPVYPQRIFRVLRKKWHKKHGSPNTPPSSPSAGDNDKRTFDKCVSDSDKEIQSKKIKLEEPARDGISAAIPGPSHAQDDYQTSSGATIIPIALPQSAAWKKRREQHEALWRQQYYLTAVGTYSISCPLLENLCPDLDGRLSMVVESFDVHTEERGLLEAYIDLGLLKGTMVMAPGLDIVRDWCCKHQSQGSRNSLDGGDGLDAETERLRDADLQWRSEKGLPMKGDLKPGPPNIEEPLELDCEARLYEDYSDLMPPSQIFGQTVHLRFTNLACRQFEGEIYLPWISKTPVRIIGFKGAPVLDTALPAFRRWLSYDTSRVKYGAV